MQEGIVSQLKNIATGLNSPLECNVHKDVDVGNSLLTHLDGSNLMIGMIKKVYLCIQMPTRSSLGGATCDTKIVPDPDL